MKAGELIKQLQKYDPDTDVMTKKTDFCGNIGEIFSVKESSYSFFGSDVPCILLTDECDDEDEESEDNE